MGIIDIAIDTDLDLIRGPPHLECVPLIHRGADVTLPLKLCVSVGLRLVSGTSEVQCADDPVTGDLIKVFRDPLN